MTESGWPEQIRRLEAEVVRLHLENERLRWRHPVIIPDWNDLSEPMRMELADIGCVYSDEVNGGDLTVEFYRTIKKRLSEPHAQNERAKRLEAELASLSDAPS